jgi:dynein heavy chain
MKIISCFFKNFEESEVKKVPEEELAELEKMINSIFIFALIWSMGCTGDYNGRIKFNEFLRNYIVEK